MPGMPGIEFQVWFEVWHARHADFCCESLSTNLVFLPGIPGCMPGDRLMAWHARYIDFCPVLVHAKSLVLRFASEGVCGRVIEIK